MSVVLPLEEFERKLRAHDWFYGHSDDNSVYKRGDENYRRLVEIAEAGGLEYKRLFNTVSREMLHGDSCPQFKPLFTLAGEII